MMNLSKLQIQEQILSVFGFSKAVVKKQHLCDINGAAMMVTSERSSHVTQAPLPHTHTNEKLIQAIGVLWN